jgi:hypothetical protein
VLGLVVMFGLARNSDRAAEAAGAVSVPQRTRTLSLATAVVVPARSLPDEPLRLLFTRTHRPRCRRPNRIPASPRLIPRREAGIRPTLPGTKRTPGLSQLATHLGRSASTPAGHRTCSDAAIHAAARCVTSPLMESAARRAVGPR